MINEFNVKDMPCNLEATLADLVILIEEYLVEWQHNLLASKNIQFPIRVLKTLVRFFVCLIKFQNENCFYGICIAFVLDYNDISMLLPLYSIFD